MTGRWPTEIDHANGRPGDNRWDNLLDRDHSANMRNGALRRDNTSGFPGIRVRSGRWRAEITVAGRRHHLGCFATIEAAIAARDAAERRNGFSLGHGRPRLRRLRQLENL